MGMRLRVKGRGLRASGFFFLVGALPGILIFLSMIYLGRIGFFK
jgi:hypothetical protein